MKSGSYMLYKGTESTDKTESAVISFSADKMTRNKEQIVLYNKDGSIGMKLTTFNGAKLRVIE